MPVPHDSDTVVTPQEPVYYEPAFHDHFAPVTVNDTSITPLDSLPVMAPAQGVAPQSQAHSPLHDTGVMAMLLVVIIFLLTSFNKGFKYVRNIPRYLFSVKRRENLFDDHTVSETRIQLALVLNTCFMEGLLVYCSFSDALQTAIGPRIALYVGITTLAAIVFYCAQLLLYRLLAWVFGDDTSAGLWLSGFNATQSLLGLTLLPVTIITLVYPSTTPTMLIVALILYILARIVFISKGIRIFFSNLSSSLYFILYLCSVEIIPSLLTYFGTLYICQTIKF